VRNNFVTTIENAIAKLRGLVQVDVQQDWHSLAEAAIKDNLNAVDFKDCQLVAVNDQGYLSFPKGKQVRWLVQKIVIPRALQGYSLAGLTLRLVLTWWAEDAKIFINGELVQQGDLFDSSARVLITDNAQPGTEYTIAIRLVSPNHDIGALMRSHLIYEKIKINNIDPGLVADELTVLLKYISQFEPDHLDVLAKEVDKLNCHNITDNHRLDRDLAKLRSSLLPLAKNIKQRCFNLLGHAHLDMAWLWTTPETYEVAERTFKSVLSLQQTFPALTFGHTSPALYEWIELNRPALFSAIEDAVRLQKWEVLGGMWIEPEVNLVSGESLIRQLLYGQEYFKAKFGDLTKVAWLPDSFGFTWQLPQILKQSGIEYFVTGKLHWNDTNKFPLGCFWWESPDGTQLLTLMSPPNVTGVMDTNPITMANYAIDWETRTGLQDMFWLPGVGDHGGGPTKDMLEVAAKWNNSPFFPEIKFSTAIEYLQKIESAVETQAIGSLPVWQDELYLELHRGCYTTHADQKKFNRDCEGLLYQAELFATLATLISGDRFVCKTLLPIMNNIKGKHSCQVGKEPETEETQDWQQQIELAWKKVLFNQFHDILPGTSIREVFEAANRDWKSAIAIGKNILQEAYIVIANWIDLPVPPQLDAQPLVVFNALNWKRSEIVTMPNSQSTIYDAEGGKVRSQLTQDNQLLFLAEDIPAVGYRLFWLSSSEAEENKQQQIDANYVLDNQYLKIIVNSETGDLDSIFDKLNQQEILSQAGNQLQAFSDQGQYWDAWNIDPKYEQYPLPPTELKSIEWLDRGELQQRIRVIRKLNKSEFQQDYILQFNSPILKIATIAIWQETHVVVKAAFPLNLKSDRVTYEIPCGAIERASQPKTSEESAKWEVPALKWADLTDNQGEYGVSLLNDCKYGYDSKTNQLRLTLLRSPLWPDPNADRGIHHFTYAIYPHQSDWKTAKTVHKGYELNIPLQVVSINDHNNSPKAKQFNRKVLPVVGEFLNLSADNLILMALKLSKNQELIMRCYESHGEVANLVIKSDLDLEINNLVDCLETEQLDNINQNQQHLSKIKPWKIASFQLKPRLGN